MDARITRETCTYRLVNKESGTVEAEGLGRIAARDLQNRLWARGIKCNMVEEV
jgi:hypothetical protein